MSAQLRLVEPRNKSRSVRPANAELRQREYLTPKEVERLIKTARDGRYGHVFVTERGARQMPSID